MELGREAGDFEVGVFVVPDGETGHPVLAVDGLAGAGPVLGRQNTGGGGEVGSGDFAADVAGGHAHLGMVADALGLSRVGAGFHVELVVVLILIILILCEPDGSGDGGAVLAEGG